MIIVNEHTCDDLQRHKRHIVFSTIEILSMMTLKVSLIFQTINTKCVLMYEGSLIREFGMDDFLKKIIFIRQVSVFFST